MAITGSLSHSQAISLTRGANESKWRASGAELSPGLSNRATFAREYYKEGGDFVEISIVFFSKSQSLHARQLVSALLGT